MSSEPNLSAIPRFCNEASTYIQRDEMDKVINKIRTLGFDLCIDEKQVLTQADIIMPQLSDKDRHVFQIMQSRYILKSENESVTQCLSSEEVNDMKPRLVQEKVGRVNQGQLA